MSEGRRTYTTEEGRRIVNGLLSGQRVGSRPLSDAEFERQYDPEGYDRRRIIQLLESIEKALWALANAEVVMGGRVRDAERTTPRDTSRSISVNVEGRSNKDTG